LVVGKSAVGLLMPDRNFWNGRSVLISGHSGFKGTWLALWLQSLGARVTGYSLDPPTHPNMCESVGLSPSINSVKGDICDGELLQQTFLDAKPEVVFHLAAQPIVLLSYNAPVETFRTNVLGTATLLEAVRKTSSAKAVVIVTSDKCYENRESVQGYRETDALGGSDPYSSSKACAELVTAAYRSSYFRADRYRDHGVAVATARAGNVIGGGDWAADRLVPDLVRAVEQGREAEIRNPLAVRPWQHVLEPLSGYILLAHRLYKSGPEFAEPWNFGPAETESRSVGWIADSFLQLWNDVERWKPDRGEHLHETRYLRIDSSKATQRLHWRARWSTAKALAESVRWYKAHAAGNAMRQFSLEQIEQYSGT
jgi:CDP-glucose 4,6-dehydratase